MHTPLQDVAINTCLCGWYPWQLIHSVVWHCFLHGSITPTPVPKFTKGDSAFQQAWPQIESIIPACKLHETELASFLSHAIALTCGRHLKKYSNNPLHASWCIGYMVLATNWHSTGDVTNFMSVNFTCLSLSLVLNLGLVDLWIYLGKVLNSISMGTVTITAPLVIDVCSRNVTSF